MDIYIYMCAFCELFTLFTVNICVFGLFCRFFAFLGPVFPPVVRSILPFSVVEFMVHNLMLKLAKLDQAFPLLCLGAGSRVWTSEVIQGLLDPLHGVSDDMGQFNGIDLDTATLILVGNDPRPYSENTRPSPVH